MLRRASIVIVDTLSQIQHVMYSLAGAALRDVSGDSTLLSRFLEVLVLVMSCRIGQTEDCSRQLSRFHPVCLSVLSDDIDTLMLYCGRILTKSY